ncbi:ketoacyl-ACP synthase III [Sporomusa sphaeroides DSM 2875]|uniref:beta-ketoacyl-ACP synthase III n=1 Tax=Sporomusa sphaeroides TaxID=47679 RepID=UPI00202F135D|nr:ketoacyl-ACP synthase III [Sporomusa sphaeroides DSM 2875]
MEQNCVGILGTGSYVPEKVITNHDLAKMIDTSDDWIVERTGIRERRVVKEGESTLDLAVKAAEKALQDAGVTAAELNAIIVATVTPDMPFPSVACLVQEKIGARNAAAFDITAVCAGFIYALATGSMFIYTGNYKKVLVIGAETMSAITDWSDRNTAILFGDGAGAVILGKTTPGYGVLSLHLGADGSGSDLLKVPAGGTRLPVSEEIVANRLHFIRMDGNEVFKFAVKVMGEAAKQVLEKANLSTDNIAYLVPHQANLRIIQSAAKRLRLPMDKVVVNVDKYGNTSAASIPIALDEAAKSGKFKNGDIIVMVGFGGGLTWGSGVVRWGK